MGFVAYKNGERIKAFDLTEADWLTLKMSEQENRTLVCPECLEQIIPKGKGSIVQNHFAHLPNLQGNRCQLSIKESDAHLHLKQLVYFVCKDIDISTDIEHKIEDSHGEYMRADVCIIDKKKVIEIQLSEQNEFEYNRRTEWYRQLGYEVMWLTWEQQNQRFPTCNIRFECLDATVKNKNELTENKVTYRFLEVLTPYSYNKVIQKKRFKVEKKIDYFYKRRNFYLMLEDFVTSKTWFTQGCEKYDKPHWCGEHCKESL